jgi:hypothetical protein
MTDRELIELAAKAAGITGFRYVDNEPIHGAYRTGVWSDVYEDCWNPLADDGDALRLAVTLRLEVCVWDTYTTVLTSDDDISTLNEPANGDSYAATRRAITRAAAEIGKGMK